MERDAVRWRLVLGHFKVCTINISQYPEKARKEQSMRHTREKQKQSATEADGLRSCNWVRRRIQLIKGHGAYLFKVESKYPSTEILISRSCKRIEPQWKTGGAGACQNEYKAVIALENWVGASWIDTLNMMAPYHSVELHFLQKLSWKHKHNSD